MADIRFDGEVFRFENGNKCNNPDDIMPYLAQSNISEERYPEALKMAYKCTKSKDLSSFVINILAEILIGGVAVLATLAMYSPLFLLINALSIAVAVYGLKLDGKYRQIIEDIKAKAKERNIPFDDIFGMAKVKDHSHSKDKSHIHEAADERVSADNNMQTSALGSLGTQFKVAGGTPETQVEGTMTLAEVEANRKEFKGNVIDGDKENIGSLADRMKLNALSKKSKEEPKEKHFKTPKLSSAPVDNVVESVKTNPSESMSSMLATLQSARANKVIDEVANVDLSSNGVSTEVQEAEVVTEEPENKQ